MRAVGPYLTAGIALTVVFWGPLLVLGFGLAEHLSGRTANTWVSSLVWSVGQTGPFAIIGFASLMVVVAPVWAVLQKLFGNGSHLRPVVNCVVRGLVLFGTFASIALAIRAGFWWQDFRASPLHNTLWFLSLGLAGGAIWGFVFGWARRMWETPSRSSH